MSENQLPAVAKSVYTSCKKCDAEKYHIVLAHTTPLSAKVQCETCGSKKTYRLPKTKTKKSAATGPNPATKRGAAAIAARKNAHSVEYQKIIESKDGEEVTSYSMKAVFTVESLVKHPKFGLGFVKTAFPDKIEVMFADEVRSLVHGRN